MIKIIYVIFLVIISACNGGGGGSSSSSFSSANGQCAPTISIGGENYSAQLCNRNQQVEQLCMNQGTPCRQDCNYRRQHQWGTGSTGQAAFNQCMRVCDQYKAACLYENYYAEGACDQPQIVPNPDCIIPIDSSTTVGTTTGGTTTGGATTGGTTTGGTTTVGTTTGGTTTGGTTTGETTTGGTTTGGPTIGSWGSVSTTSSPSARRSQTAIWTGSEMIIWGGFVTGAGNTNTGGRYNPISNSWINLPNSISGTPTTRDGHTAVWTGSEMIVWGGYQDSQQTSYGYADAGPTNTGASYDPSTNSWNQTSITGAPVGRYGHTSIWTGTRMLVWGGKIAGSSTFTNTGSSYNPTTFTWSTLPSPNVSNAPSSRWQHTAVWTGSEMIVWGGLEDDGSTKTNTGGRFNPSTNTWTALAMEDAPSARTGHTAVWTGTEMIVWGGNGRTGAKYNPSTNTWSGLSTENAPFGKGHTAVWTGSEMIVWGGAESDGITLSYSNGGSRYNPSTNTWSPMSSTDAPSARNSHSAVWGGGKLIIWGGGNQASGNFVNTGGRFNP